MSPSLKFTSGVRVEEGVEAELRDRRRRSPTGRRRRSSCSSTSSGCPASARCRCPGCRPAARLTLNGLTERLWNCSVESPLFMPSSLRRHARQQLLAAAKARLGEAARIVAPRRDVGELRRSSASTPPSLTSKNWNGLAGLVTSACWSGCRPFGWQDVGRVHRHVGGGDAGVGREHDAALVGERSRRTSTSRPRRRCRGGRRACRRSCRTSTGRCTSCAWRSRGRPGWSWSGSRTPARRSRRRRCGTAALSGAAAARPSWTYMRVLPFGSTVTANSGRVVVVAPSSATA